MTIKNFSIEQGLDLDGLVLTNGNGELLVNGNAISVDAATIANAIAGQGLVYGANVLSVDYVDVAQTIVSGGNIVVNQDNKIDIGPGGLLFGGNNTSSQIQVLSGDINGPTNFHVQHVFRPRAWEVPAGTTKTESTVYNSGEILIRATTAGGIGSRMSKLIHTSDGLGNFGYSEYGIIEVGNTVPVNITMFITGDFVSYAIENTSETANVYVTTSETSMGAIQLPAGEGGAGGGK
jgi:hypothetical protein